jgi:hypothetical protein
VASSDVAPECEGASVFSCEASGEPSMQLVLSSFDSKTALPINNSSRQRIPVYRNHGLYCIRVIFIYPYLFFSRKHFFSLIFAVTYKWENNALINL